VSTFDGKPTDGYALKVSGSIGSVSAARVGPLEVAEEWVGIVLGYVTKVEHADKDGRLIRTHTVKVTELVGVERDTAQQMLAEIRRRERLELDELLGRRPLFDEGP
jgi:hypothetical protein